MKKSRVENENYVHIQGFMVKELKLKGNELIIYAIIYGFSQAENQKFTGSLQYLADWTNSTKQGVLKNLKSLIEKGLIEKEDVNINGVKFCKYYATKLNKVLNKVEQGIKQSLTPTKQSLTEGIKQSLTNNIDNNNIINNIFNNKENNSSKAADEISPNEFNILKNEFEDLWSKYPKKRGKKEAFEIYCKYRKATNEDYITKDDVEDGIEQYNRYIKTYGIEDKYIKSGANYFIEKAWEDDYKVEQSKSNFMEWLELHQELA